MSENTKPNTTKKKPKRADTMKKTKKVSLSHISLPGGRQIKMKFAYWIILLTIIAALIVFLVTLPNRTISNHIKSLESKDEVVAYCIEKDLNCTFTILTDYDIEGYNVSRVSFLDDDFFDSGEVVSEVVETASGSENEQSSKSKSKKNVYITVQQGISIAAE